MRKWFWKVYSKIKKWFWKVYSKIKKWFWKVCVMMIFIYHGGFTAGPAWYSAGALSDTYYPGYTPKDAYFEDLSYM